MIDSVSFMYEMYGPLTAAEGACYTYMYFEASSQELETTALSSRPKRQPQVVLGSWPGTRPRTGAILAAALLMVALVCWYAHSMCSRASVVRRACAPRHSVTSAGWSLGDQFHRSGRNISLTLHRMACFGGPEAESTSRCRGRRAAAGAALGGALPAGRGRSPSRRATFEKRPRLAAIHVRPREAPTPP